jgi:DNA repair photolyase
MGLNKQKGQMYDWITHTHTHLGGKCPHECSYCSIQDMQKRFGDKLPYSGPLRLREKEFGVNYGSGKTIFIENCNDLFADGVERKWIDRILDHCREYPGNDYVIQTKNPNRIITDGIALPDGAALGCTIETNRDNDLGNTPSRSSRAWSMSRLQHRRRGLKTFITLEPIMDFDLHDFAYMLIGARPNFVNIGADSKNHFLPEPSIEKIMQLAEILSDAGIEIRKKMNLDRLKSKI